MIKNPLLNVTIGWFGNLAASQSFGWEWRTTLWERMTVAVDEWLLMNAGATATNVKQFVESHISQFVAALTHGNPFIAVMVSELLQPVFNSLVDGIVNYALEKVSPTSGTADQAVQ